MDTTSHAQGPLYKCMSGIYKGGGGQSLDVGLSWDRAGPEEPEERKGRGLAGLAAEEATAALRSPCPAAFHLLLPTCPRKGPPGPGLAGEGPSLSATEDY